MRHLKIFVSSSYNLQGRHYALEYVGIYHNEIYMNDSTDIDFNRYSYKITSNNNKLIIQDNTASHGPTLSTICWL